MKLHRKDIEEIVQHEEAEGSFFYYVDKMRWVGGTGNANDMQIFPYSLEFQRTCSIFILF